jgi:hypothetical protein
MKALGMEAPQYICLSGRGAQSINILDEDAKKEDVTKLTQAIFEKVYEVKEGLQETITLRMAEKFKEATCNGGVLRGPEDRPDPQSVVLVGGDLVAKDEKEQKTYTQIKSDGTTLKAVMANIGKFADTLVDLNNSLNFHKMFAIDANMNEVAATLKQKVQENIDLGLARHNYARRPNEKISETLFFYPLIQNLFELGKKVAGK